MLARLDELSARVRKPADPAPWGSDPLRVALAALIAVAQERDAEASACLALLRDRLAHAKPGPGEPGWPEFVAATAALRRPALRTEASALLDAAVKALPRSAPDSALSLSLRHWADVARLPGRSLAEPPACVPALAHWVPSSRVTAATHGGGFPQVFWTFFAGELQHHPGHLDDVLTFASPLLGDFEVNCELNLGGHRAVRVDYGGLGLEISPDGKRRELFPQRHRPGRPPSTRPSICATTGTPTGSPCGRETARSRSTVAPFTTAACLRRGTPGSTIHSSRTTAAGFRKLRITGNPLIPEHLELAHGPGLHGWRADYYADTLGFHESDWLKVGDQIRGSLVRVKAGRHQESVLQYEHPMSGNDSIEYEFEYEPGRILVHPTLDRLVFILDPSGVVVHWLTDAGARSRRSHVRQPPVGASVSQGTGKSVVVRGRMESPQDGSRRRQGQAQSQRSRDLRADARALQSTHFRPVSRCGSVGSPGPVRSLSRSVASNHSGARRTDGTSLNWCKSRGLETGTRFAYRGTGSTKVPTSASFGVGALLGPRWW